MNDQRALAAAACDGDITAMRALADWFRDRNKPSDASTDEAHASDVTKARWLDLLAFETLVRRLQAQQIRVILPQLLRDHEWYLYQNQTMEAFTDVLCSVGLPVEWCRRNGRDVWRVPTDGEHEQQTRDQFIALLKRVFPRRRRFTIEFDNAPISEEGEEACFLLIGNELGPIT